MPSHGWVGAGGVQLPPRNGWFHASPAFLPCPVPISCLSAFTPGSFPIDIPRTTLPAQPPHTVASHGFHGAGEHERRQHGGAGRAAARAGVPDGGALPVAAHRPPPRHAHLLPAVQGATRRRVGAGGGGAREHGRAHGVGLPPRRGHAAQHQPLPQRRRRRHRPRAGRPRPHRPVHPGVGGQAVEDGPVHPREGSPDRRIQGHAAV